MNTNLREVLTSLKLPPNLGPVSLPVSIMKCSQTMVLLLHSVGDGSTWLFKAKVISSTVEKCYPELDYRYNKLHLSQTYIIVYHY